MGDEIAIDFNPCATVSLAEASKLLGIHRSTAWELYKRGEFPVRVLKIGSRLRVTKHHLCQYLCGSRARIGLMARTIRLRPATAT